MLQSKHEGGSRLEEMVKLLLAKNLADPVYTYIDVVILI